MAAKGSNPIIGALVWLFAIGLIGGLIGGLGSWTRAKSSAQVCIKNQTLSFALYACETAEDLRDYLDASTSAKLDEARQELAKAKEEAARTLAARRAVEAEEEAARRGLYVRKLPRTPF